jgi:Kef-type K+ transport system membrane component KefB
MIPFNWLLVLVFGTFVGTALLARWTSLPITALEIVAGITLAAAFGIDLPDQAQGLLILGSLLIVFLAGLETNFGFLRRHWRTALSIGIPGFLVPFAGLFVLFQFVLHAPLLVSIIGATALADTSISIVYTTLHQYELAELPIGRMVLAATLAVNLVEDLTITTTTALSTPGLVFTGIVIVALAVAALLLPRLTKALSEPQPSFSNIGARSLLFSIAVLAALSSLAGVPGILFVFLLGLLFSQFAKKEFLVDVRKLSFALFVPVYFLAVGLRVDFMFVVANLAVLGAIVAVATVLKVGAIFPTARRYLGPARAAPVATLMNTRLTSATVILLLSLTLGLITTAWYSLFISAVVVLSLGSVLVLRALPSFRSTAAARELFQGGEFAEPLPGVPRPAPDA